jgi:hypothetical protein
MKGYKVVGDKELISYCTKDNKMLPLKNKADVRNDLEKFREVLDIWGKIWNCKFWLVDYYDGDFIEIEECFMEEKK